MAYTVTYATGWEAGVLSFYQQSNWIHSGVVPAINTNANFLHRTLSGVGSNYSLNFNEGNAPTINFISPIFPISSRWVNFWYKTSSTYPAASATALFFLNSANNYQAAINFNYSNQSLDLYVDNALKGSSASGTWITNRAYWVSIYYVADPAAGRMKIYLNGVLVLDTTLFSPPLSDTSSTGVAGWQKISFGRQSGITTFPAALNNHGFSGYIDDLIITDDDGGTIVASPPFSECIGFPASLDADASVGLTPVPVGSNFNNVNDFPAQQVTYNQATVSGQEDLYGVAAMSLTPASITAVSVWSQAARDGLISQAEIKVVSGASTTYGTVEVLPASPAFGSIARFFGFNPNGGAAWTKATVDALEVGIRFT